MIFSWVELVRYLLIAFLIGTGTWFAVKETDNLDWDDDEKKVLRVMVVCVGIALALVLIVLSMRATAEVGGGSP
jgi:hypothetical protein